MLVSVAGGALLALLSLLVLAFERVHLYSRDERRRFLLSVGAAKRPNGFDIGQYDYHKCHRCMEWSLLVPPLYICIECESEALVLGFTYDRAYDPTVPRTRLVGGQILSANREE